MSHYIIIHFEHNLQLSILCDSCYVILATCHLLEAYAFCLYQSRKDEVVCGCLYLFSLAENPTLHIYLVKLFKLP